MTVKPLDIEQAIASVKKALADEPSLSPALAGALETWLRREVTEYRAEVWVDDTGQRWVAPFPEHINARVQYGPTCKAHAVYLSQGQLLPYERVRETFADQLGVPLSAGTLANFNREAFERLAPFEQAIQPLLADQSVLHVDETGINIDGQRRWRHTAGNPSLTHYAAHAKRGQEAMNDIGILPYFTGVLCHDHWKPYDRYTARQHALCNAHHLRELERAAEDGQAGAKTMQTLLLDLHQATETAGGVLGAGRCQGLARAIVR